MLKSTEAGGSGNCQICRMVAQVRGPLRDWLPKRGSPSGEGLRVLGTAELYGAEADVLRQFVGTYFSLAEVVQQLQVIASGGTLSF
jgi:hypothetical protein